MKEIEVYPPVPQRTQELRDKGWRHRCTDLRWYPVKGMPKAEGAQCPECGSVRYRWKWDR